ncbi:glycosyltransferase [Schlesneria sp. T3-172]|uniref:glycosyltransferase n=1 Tax=Schlesneria sphaerica TaxID=3373610 RepID=UPI0037CA19B2
MVSIIIPAYNEEAVIGRALSYLLEGADRTALDVIVCCNGCVDRTAEIARSFGPPVRVVETPRGSKTLALNMGDEAARSFPRIYLDADILLSYDAVKKLTEALTDNKQLAAAPRMRVNLTGRPWFIRAFYDVWLRTPYHTRGMIGSGLYALSEEGRRRFEVFPEIIADDSFVHAHFTPDERKTVESCDFTVTPPASFAGLIKIKTRAKLGSLQLAQRFPDLMRQFNEWEKADTGRDEYRNLLKQPLMWPKLGVFTFVKMIALMRASRQLKKLKGYRWERDDTSRA